MESSHSEGKKPVVVTSRYTQMMKPQVMSDYLVAKHLLVLAFPNAKYFLQDAIKTTCAILLGLAIGLHVTLLSRVGDASQFPFSSELLV
jgi:hypothetical protein